jgi:hypothetical protein
VKPPPKYEERWFVHYAEELVQRRYLEEFTERPNVIDIAADKTLAAVDHPLENLFVPPVPFMAKVPYDNCDDPSVIRALSAAAVLDLLLNYYSDALGTGVAPRQKLDHIGARDVDCSGPFIYRLFDKFFNPGSYLNGFNRHSLGALSIPIEDNKLTHYMTTTTHYNAILNQIRWCYDLFLLLMNGDRLPPDIRNEVQHIWNSPLDLDGIEARLIEINETAWAGYEAPVPVEAVEAVEAVDLLPAGVGPLSKKYNPVVEAAITGVFFVGLWYLFEKI